jgi:hypothetical protein
MQKAVFLPQGTNIPPFPAKFAEKYSKKKVGGAE